MSLSLSWLWIAALAGFGVCGIALQQRMGSLAALLREQRPDLWARIETRGGTWSAPALMRWLIGGDWRGVPEPLIQAYAQTCLRLLRLTLAWLVALVVTIILFD